MLKSEKVEKEKIKIKINTSVTKKVSEETLFIEYHF